MTGTQSTRRGLSGGCKQEVLFAGGAGTRHSLTARPVVVITAGRIEYAARCPQCRDWHRHVSLGEKTAPCGAVYLLEPKRGRAAA